MSFKTLLVHLDSSARCDARLSAAIRLAIDTGARLVGVYLSTMPDLSSSVASLLPAEVIASRGRELGDAQHAAEKSFRETTAAAGLTRIEWRAPAGPAVAEMVAHGRNSDLVVLGQRGRSGEASDSDFADELIATTLMSVGRPLLVVPYIGAARTLGKRILIAWNGSREAARAVGDAMPLLERAERVDVIADPGTNDGEVAHTLSNQRVVQWLADHGCDARIEPVPRDAIDVGDILLSRAADYGTDLIVMGGYGHSRLRELVLGGATRTLLGAMTVPVLMSH